MCRWLPDPPGRPCSHSPELRVTCWVRQMTLLLLRSRSNSSSASRVNRPQYQSQQGSGVSSGASRRCRRAAASAAASGTPSFSTRVCGKGGPCTNQCESVGWTDISIHEVHIHAQIYMQRPMLVIPPLWDGGGSGPWSRRGLVTMGMPAGALPHAKHVTLPVGPPLSGMPSLPKPTVPKPHPSHTTLTHTSPPPHTP